MKSEEIVLTRFDDLKASADRTKAIIEELTQAIRDFDKKTRNLMPVELVEILAGLTAQFEKLPALIEGVKGIADENVQLHRALQEGHRVKYGRPEDMV
ncbi:hypothetical protein [Oceanibaculum sp.]|uniref:hypothetical protein n=1 Tax=Oceanibaculum sp. TaxID=1903597 RepID=UPI002589D1E5|nr:hypothetical protein [Oceanibaculum sp.]MCH2393215.1 hypothetical protein [Oceanibaculum sp.]